MKMKPLFQRLALPILLTGIFALLLASRSELSQIFPQHSNAVFVLLLATGCLVGICWWIALAERRYKCLISRIFQPAALNVVIIFFGLLALCDLFLDPLVLLVWLPLLVGLIMLWITQERPWGLRSRQTHILEWVSRVALVVGASLFSLILAEVAFRYVLLESHVPANNEKFEQSIVSTWPRTIPVQRDPDTFRILGLSDSFGESGGRKNYHYILETLFADAGVTVEVMNFSRGGYEPFDQLALFKRFAARYQPDLILHGFYVGNDFGAPTTPLLAYQRILLRPADGLDSFRPRNFLLFKWFRFYRTVIRDKSQKASEAASAPPAPLTDQPIAVRDKGPKESETTSAPPTPLTDQPMKVGAKAATKTKKSKSRGTFSQAEFSRIARNHLNFFRSEQPASMRQRWQQTAAVIDEIRAEAERIGSDYVMVIHPDQLQVDHELVLELEEDYDLDLSLYDLALPQRFLIDQCVEDNIQCLDLLPAFKEHPGPLYLPRDTHYNNNGNRLAAETIVDLLLNLELFSEAEADYSGSE